MPNPINKINPDNITFNANCQLTHIKNKGLDSRINREIT